MKRSKFEIEERRQAGTCCSLRQARGYNAAVAPVMTFTSLCVQCNSVLTGGYDPLLLFPSRTGTLR
jgi:hypothetical protein